ncbi:tRNA modification GTPase GTPBP3, mitochondrial [Toxorhynchites rutilus septentrionalis]|uniref:tRNA modification GTPase GTPBP3, mitochondrial n=1 Tax=Toxorhynchites rutilus septentrionalis TaxID=329112 RepID=UPI002478B82E|nr:tRNA modification GTPase GTPBP3, mitochondrial [Toxorhynchites rutilus septentrionalis]
MFSRAVYIRSLLRTRCYSSKSTIFGLSSGAGKCGVAVIRVSGEASSLVVKCKTSVKTLPAPRKAVLRRIFHSRTDEIIDKGLILWFPGPNSFTGEDSVEFHVHGGVAVLNAMYDSLGSISGVRIAEPGEFTKRAFYAGKLDLTEVEGLADLIDAETEAQRKQALSHASGDLSKLYNQMRTKLLKCIAHVEAYIDFSEDQDIDDTVLESVRRDVNSLICEIRTHLDDHRRGERLRTGVRMAIIGAPNVGKSSFINLLSNRKVSIVTNIAGTTRDIVESNHDIGGYPVTLADTAGLRNYTTDVVENEGIERARDYLQLTDILVLMLDAGSLQDYLSGTKKSFSSYFKDYVGSLGLSQSLISSTRLIVIVNKCDLLSKETLNLLQDEADTKILSCHTRVGIDRVLEVITCNLKELCGVPSRENPNLSQQRHRYHLKECVECLEKFQLHLEMERHPDLAIATQYLRNATRCIGRITGAVQTEEILDVIFSSFCIGK